MELIGFKNITLKEKGAISELLKDCSIISLNDRIKEEYVEIRKSHNLKLPDAIIAATALAFDFPLITADKQFKTIEALKLITYQHSVKLA